MPMPKLRLFFATCLYAQVRWGLLLALVAVTGCGTVQMPSSVATLYPPQPGAAGLPSSAEQASATRKFPATFDEVLDAAYQAAFRRGLVIEEKDAKKGRIVGSGQWQMVCVGGPCQMYVTFAAYAREVDRAPTTELIVYMDRYGGAMNTGSGLVATGNPSGRINELFIDMQKIIATQR